MNIIGRIIRRLYINVYTLWANNFTDNIKVTGKLDFRKGFKINCSEGGKVTIGKNCFFNNYCSVNSHEFIEIGDDCIFGEGVKIYDHNHVFKMSEMRIKEQGFSCKRIKIGNNCWIASNAVILPGADIGDGVVIGAGCVVNMAIESNMIARNGMMIHLEPRKEDYGKFN